MSTQNVNANVVPDVVVESYEDTHGRYPNRSVLGKRVALQLNERRNLNPLLWYHTCNLWIVIQLPEVSTTEEQPKNCCEITPKKKSQI
jgi:hypothetical protein